MNNETLKMTGRAALKIAREELDDLHEKIRSKEEQTASDREFIKSLQNQIKILNKESYDLKSERDEFRATQNITPVKNDNQLIIWRGIAGLLALVLIIIAAAIN